ncbi:unnamed protein product [Heterobilharzia americana]|nr:unnamed protein product [Heterobilharzia americana]
MISNPTPGKSYRVYCNATNSAGWMISEPPATGAIAFLNSEFRLHPSDIEADEGTSDSYLSNIRITAGGNLKIHPTNVEDTGNYICAALNLVGQRLSHSAYVNIKPRDYNYKTSKLIRARQGEQVKLFCPDTKDKPVKWKRKLKQLTVTSNRIEQRKTMLIIRHAVFSDSDIYICTTLDGKESEVRLTVETPPIFLKSPTDLTLNLGDKAIFPCVADGYPKPGIYWELPDKSPVFPTDNLTEDTSNKYKVHVDGTLEITSVTFKDAGKYHCIAHSSVDMVQTSATLRIQRRKKNSMPASNHSRVLNKLKEVFIEMNSSKFLKYVPPYIGLPPSNKTQVVGESVLIDCELPRLVRIVSPGKLQNVDNLGHNYRKVFDIQSTENWEISWRRAVLLHTNMNQLTYEMIHGKNVRFKILQSGSLQINDLQISDSGIYTCQVKDETNVKYEVAVHLSVLFSKPKEAISDYLQEYPLSAPNNLQVMNTTDRSITLSWNPPFLYSTDGQSRSILPMNYWIEIYTPERSDEGWMAVERTWPVNLITLNGISSDIPYYIIVRARLGEGRVGWASDPFGPIFTKTSKIYSKYTSRRPDSSMEQLALKPVELRNIQLTVLSPKSIHVSWNVFEMPSVLSRVNGYIIYYRSVEHVRCLNDKYLQTGPNDANFVNNYCSLNPENYHKSSGVNEIYNRLELMRQIYQEEQENNITDSVTSLPGVISTVTIEAHYTKGVQDSKESQPINHKVTSLLTELRPFRCYEVGIKAFHEKVSVSYLETRDIFTHTALTYETSPMSAPRNIFAGWLFGGNLELGWTAPPVSEWNGIILGYIVYIHDEVLKTYQNVNVSSEGRKITISLNSLPKAFSIQLAAYTCVGIGVRSESLKIDTNQNIFQKVTEICLH